jgi:hypothetical protein
MENVLATVPSFLSLNRANGRSRNDRKWFAIVRATNSIKKTILTHQRNDFFSKFRKKLYKGTKAVLAQGSKIPLSFIIIAQG